MYSPNAKDRNLEICGQSKEDIPRKKRVKNWIKLARRIPPPPLLDLTYYYMWLA
jgi:hypothetical protein